MQYIRVDRTLASFAGPIGSQRYCVVPGRLVTKGPERNLDADSRVAQMTTIGFCKVSVESKEWLWPLLWIKLFSACSETTWTDALLFMFSSMACADNPSCMQYFFMLLKSRLLALALNGPIVEFASRLPKPMNPTDTAGEARSREVSREPFEGSDVTCRSGRATLTVVPCPLLLRTWTVPPSDLTI